MIWSVNRSEQPDLSVGLGTPDYDMHGQRSSIVVCTIWVTQHKMLQFFELWVNNVFQHTPVMGGYHTLEKITHQATEHINFVYMSNVLCCSIRIFSSSNAYIIFPKMWNTDSSENIIFFINLLLSSTCPCLVTENSQHIILTPGNIACNIYRL